MAFPVFTLLPPFPDRLGAPDNFENDSQVFISAQPTLRNNSNTVSAYLNTLALDPFNWGNVAIPNPVRQPLLKSPPTAVPNVDTGLDFVTKTDAVLESIGTLPVRGNLTGNYVDALASASEPYGIVLDSERPTIGLVSESQRLDDGITVYESKAVDYYNTQTAFANAFSDFEEYVYFRLVADDDFGLLNEPITIIDDFGALT